MHVLTGICYPDGLASLDVPLPCQESPYGGRIRLEEEIPYLAINMRMPMGGEVLARWTGPRNVLALQMVIGTFCATVSYTGQDGAGAHVCRDQPRGYTSPGDATVLPDAWSGLRISCNTWSPRRNPRVLLIPFSFLPSDTPSSSQS